MPLNIPGLLQSAVSNRMLLDQLQKDSLFEVPVLLGAWWSWDIA